MSPAAVNRSGILKDAAAIDNAVYEAVASTPTPTLDRAMRGLSEAANHSKLSLASAAALSLLGGSDGRAAAKMGLASVALTSTFVNIGIKPLARRRRPDLSELGVPSERRVKLPRSGSFPSGHSAAAFAFATGVGQVLPSAAIPLRGLAALVAYSRVHTGVHYPGDVVAGSLIGTAIAQVTTHTLGRHGQSLSPS
jgi:membrane-associated phospholipid phosphatase